jgi:hypothetical protein
VTTDGRIPDTLYPPFGGGGDEPSVRDLVARADAETTFAHIAEVLGSDELHVTLTALAVLRARDAAERRRN